MPRLRCALTEERTSHISIWDLACMHCAHTVTSGIITNYQGKCWKNKQHTSNPCVCAVYRPGEGLLVKREKGRNMYHVDNISTSWLIYMPAGLCVTEFCLMVYTRVFSCWTEQNFQNKLDFTNESIMKMMKTFCIFSSFCFPLMWLMLAFCHFCLFSNVHVENPTVFPLYNVFWVKQWYNVLKCYNNGWFEQPQFWNDWDIVKHISNNKKQWIANLFEPKCNWIHNKSTFIINAC